MSEWKTVFLGDICKNVTSGGTPASTMDSYYYPPTIPWLKTKEVNYCRIYDVENYISEEGLRNSSAKMIPSNSVIVAMYGQGDTAGRVAINKIPLTTNQACCNLIIDDKVADYEYVYYNLCTLYNKLVSLKNGGAQPNLNAKIIKGIEIKLPPLSTQHRISTILSRYDSLIENYQKQIKLLEESAQRLYKEWFVDLRFPGYENTPVVDGVPEGWEKNRLENLVFDSGKRISKRNRYSYDCYIPIDCLPKKQITYININSVEQAESSLIAFSPGDIIFGAMRPYFHKVCIARHYGITRTTCFVLRAKESEYDAFASMLLFNEETVKYASSISVGTTMPYARWNDFKNMAILVPTIEIARKFNNVVLKNLSSIGRLANQLSLLTEARDRLLPKLMSGEIEV